MRAPRPTNTDAYSMILEAIDIGTYRPGDRLVESELAERFGVSRTPVREALQRLETQSLLSRDGRSLIVASLDHNQMSELYVVRRELEGLAASLAAQHATAEEVRILRDMVEADNELINDPPALARANRRFHTQIHLASHNRYLVQQLDLVHRTMALMATTFTPKSTFILVAYSTNVAAADPPRPLPLSSVNRKGMICVAQLTPARPMRLSPTAPIVPAVCVPCELTVASGSLSPSTWSMP